MKLERARRRLSEEAGGATVELAMALPALMGLLALILAVGGLTLAQLRCADAARAGARAAALGQDTVAVAGIVRELAGDRATAAIAQQGGTVSVTARLPVAFGVGKLTLGGLVERSATAVCEPSSPCGQTGLR